jgi:hypothetical protein
MRRRSGSPKIIQAIRSALPFFWIKLTLLQALRRGNPKDCWVAELRC